MGKTAESEKFYGTMNAILTVIKVIIIGFVFIWLFISILAAVSDIPPPFSGIVAAALSIAIIYFAINGTIRED